MTYDCFTFFNELDLLEIRFNILDQYVDHFVLCESFQTFSGKSKPLYYEENKARFEKWNHKIIHLIAPAGEFGNSFDRAAFQKEYLKNGLKDAKDDDIVFFGDLDEIWISPIEFASRVYNLKQLNYCYYLNNRSSEQWVGTIVGPWEVVKAKSFNHWRANHENELDNGGWHFTNAGGPDQIRKKLEAYDHVEFDRSDIKESIEEKIANGEDYVGRRTDWQGKPFEFWLDETDLPEYIKNNKLRYEHLFK